MLPAPGFVGLDGQLSRPYADESTDRLRLHSSTTDFAALRPLVAARMATAQEFGGTLRLEIPLRLGTPPQLTIPVTVLLTSVDTGQEHRLRARVLAPAGPGSLPATLVTEVGAVQIAYGASSGRWTIGVGAGDAYADLGVHLIYRGGKAHDHWSIAPAWRNVLDGLTSGIRRHLAPVAVTAARADARR